MGIESIPIILMGVLVVFLFFLIVTIFDIIRDKNWIWLLIVLVVPFLGMVLYWLFGNIPSKQKRRKSEKEFEMVRRKKGFNPFKMPLPYIGVLLTLIFVKVPSICMVPEYFGSCLPRIGFIILVGFVGGWIINSIFRLVTK